MIKYLSLRVRNRVLNKYTLLIFIFVVVILVYHEYDFYSEEEMKLKKYSSQNADCSTYQLHRSGIEKYYDKKKYWRTSNLGSVLFKNIDPAVFRHVDRENKTFVVLIWKYWEWLKYRHVRTFSETTRNVNPLEECSVKNCIFTGDHKHMETADAVVVHMQKGLFPKVERRDLSQRWVFLSDESPRNTFSLASKKPTLSSMGNVFNWTMTYRSDSDIPVPYGRTVPLKEPIIQNMEEEFILHRLIPNWSIKRSDVLVTVLMSNCAVKYRMKFITKLQQYIPVDVHGGCSTNKHRKSCPGHFKSDCKVMSEYLFYLVLENSMCRQYLTEKVFHNAYSKGAVPVIMGPTLLDCENLLPPNSFLHIDNFESVAELARYLKKISANQNLLLSFHNWRNNYKIVNEHGYFGSKSYHYCRVCEALNYNDGEISIYDEDDLRLFFDPNITCTT